MRERKEAKREAIRLLRGHRKKAAGVVGVQLAALLMVSLGDSLLFTLLGYRFPTANREALAVTAATAVAWVLLLAPLSVGVWGWYLDLAEGQAGSPLGVLGVYEGGNYFRALGLCLLVAARTVGVGLLLFAMPAAALYFGVDYLTWSVIPSGMIELLLALAGVLAVGWSLVLLVFVQRYAAAPLLLWKKAGSPRQAARASAECTRGNRWSLMLLELSFLPWYLLCILVLPAFYVLPYHAMARVCLCQRLWQRRGEPEDPQDSGA